MKVFGRENLEYVFRRLSEHGLKLKISKCHFFQKEVTFLGHLISGDGVSTDPKKTQAIKDWRQPQTQRELRGFLGMAGYYRRFVKGFFQIAAPLHALPSKAGRKCDTKQKSPSKHRNVKSLNKLWTEDCTVAFEKLEFPNFGIPRLYEAVYS